MKNFALPPWRKKQIASKFSRKDRVIRSAVMDMEQVMRKAVDYIFTHYTGTDHFPEPSLSEMFAVGESFYRNVITQSWNTAAEEKKSQKGKKKLAKIPIGKIPTGMKDLQDLFRDKRYWPRIMKRSKVLTERLRKQYLQKLRRKFRDLVPQLRAGEITVEEAKKNMMQAWDASRGRVETIFRTETTTYFGRTQVAYFKNDPEIIGYLFDSVRDTGRTEICRSRHGLIYRPGTKLLDENTPALHYRCRSHLLALANNEHNRKMLEDPQRDPSSRKVAPLPPGWRK